MIKHPTTRIRLSQDVRMMARLSATAIEQTRSEYLASPIRLDAKHTGIDQLITKDALEVPR